MVGVSGKGANPLPGLARRYLSGRLFDRIEHSLAALNEPRAAVAFCHPLKGLSKERQERGPG